jgi:trehalose synthase
VVIEGNQEFFAVTKRIHHLLHGQPGDEGQLGDWWFVPDSSVTG